MDRKQVMRSLGFELSKPFSIKQCYRQCATPCLARSFQATRVLMCVIFALKISTTRRYLFMQANALTSWAAYVAGCLLVLAHECGVAFQGRSVAILVSSDVPEGVRVCVCVCACVRVQASFALFLTVNKG